MGWRKMELAEEQGKQIEEVALSYLGREYRIDFNCRDFVEMVYSQVGMPMPLRRLNITREELENPPVGHIIFLRHKGAPRHKVSTHVGIIISGKRCIHNSYYFGKQVVVTSFEELFKVYDLAICYPETNLF